MRTAIVVDDEPITKMDITEILQEAQFDVIASASDGFDAVNLCRLHNPDIVLIDIKMPLFDGLSAAEVIIQDDLAGCVVIITAFSNMEFIERAKQIGVTGYLVKPVEERLIIPTLEIAFAQSKRYNQSVADVKELSRKLEERKLIDRAKIIVSKSDNISEGNAYTQMRKMSMDKRCSMAEIASMIVSGGSGKSIIEKAKKYLTKTYGISDDKAYKKLKEYSANHKCSLELAAMKLLNKGEADVGAVVQTKSRTLGRRNQPSQTD